MHPLYPPAQSGPLSFRGATQMPAAPAPRASTGDFEMPKNPLLQILDVPEKFRDAVKQLDMYANAVGTLYVERATRCRVPEKLLFEYDEFLAAWSKKRSEWDAMWDVTVGYNATELVPQLLLWRTRFQTYGDLLVAHCRAAATGQPPPTWPPEGSGLWWGLALGLGAVAVGYGLYRAVA